jgi:hypothetical protein
MKADRALCGSVALRAPFTYTEYVGNIAIWEYVGVPDELNSITVQIHGVLAPLIVWFTA